MCLSCQNSIFPFSHNLIFSATYKKSILKEILNFFKIYCTRQFSTLVNLIRELFKIIFISGLFNVGLISFLSKLDLKFHWFEGPKKSLLAQRVID